MPNAISFCPIVVSLVPMPVRRSLLSRAAIRVATLASALLLTTAPAAAPIVLYDATLANRPQDQPWLTYIAPLGPPATVVAAGTNVNTTNSGSTADDAGLLAGFFNHDLRVSLFPPADHWTLRNPAFPRLDPVPGFRLGFDLQLHDEDHSSSHRAGFSLILLGQDRRGVELGFWEDQVFAQGGPGFTRAESAAWDTAAALGHYELTILGLDYLLTANGQPVLGGVTRDYSPASPFPDPYDIPNMLFLGDNTRSAAANFTLGRVTIETGPFATDIPLPPVWALLAWALMLRLLPTLANRGRVRISVPRCQVPSITKAT